jgi:hypothetical protein
VQPGQKARNYAEAEAEREEENEIDDSPTV